MKLYESELLHEGAMWSGSTGRMQQLTKLFFRLLNRSINIGNKSDANAGIRPIKPVALKPTRPLYIVGDVHGHIPALEVLLEQINADVQANGFDDSQLIFLGDLIDRGEHSADVLKRVQGLCAELPDMVVCLKGNHEHMMLGFLDNPERFGPGWLKSGGLQTAASFGVRDLRTSMPNEALVRLATDVRSAMPPGQEAWLRSLPLMHQDGNILCVHAAADPALPPDIQEERILLWGHEGFMRAHRSDSLCVVHGHTIVDTPLHAPTRIAVDTGAYFSGVLTAAKISPLGDLRFLQTNPESLNRAGFAGG